MRSFTLSFTGFALGFAMLVSTLVSSVAPAAAQGSVQLGRPDSMYIVQGGQTFNNPRTGVSGEICNLGDYQCYARNTARANQGVIVVQPQYGYQHQQQYSYGQRTVAPSPYHQTGPIAAYPPQQGMYGQRAMPPAPPPTAAQISAMAKHTVTRTRAPCHGEAGYGTLSDGNCSRTRWVPGD